MAIFKQNTGITGSLTFGYSSGSAATGSVWFNTGSQALQYISSGEFKAWSTGGDMITARERLGSLGTDPSNALAFGGATPTLSALTEEYNGSTETWSSTSPTNDLTAATCYLRGAGTVNAGLAFGGRSPATTAVTEEYSGTAWSTAGPGLISARYVHAGFGTQNAALAVGGTPVTTTTEEYDGVTESWSSAAPTSNTSQNFFCHAGAGTVDAGLVFGGANPSSPFAPLTCTEEYIGGSWSTGGALNIGREDLAGTGTQNAALAFGGHDNAGNEYGKTEEYDGTAWSSGRVMLTGRCELGGAGTQGAAVAFGGSNPGIVASTEEYNTVSNFTVEKF